MPHRPRNYTGEVRRGVRVLGRVRGESDAWWCECLTCKRFVKLKSKRLHGNGGGSKSCGCIMRDLVNHIKHRLQQNQHFGQLTTVRCLTPPNQPQVWLCRCACGNYKNATAHSLANGRTQSCGCGIGWLTKPRLLKCRFCRKEFLARKGQQVHCSTLCCSRNTNGYVGPVEKNCNFCDKPFIAARASTSSWCSQLCRNRAAHRRRLERQALQQFAELTQLLKETP